MVEGFENGQRSQWNGDHDGGVGGGEGCSGGEMSWDFLLCFGARVRLFWGDLECCCLGDGACSA